MNRLKGTNMSHKFLFIVLVCFIMLFLTNFKVENSLYHTIRNVLALSFVIFISGYTFICLIFEKELENVEIFVLSVGASISITILVGMLDYFINLEITFFNFINQVTIITLILSFIGVFKKGVK